MNYCVYILASRRNGTFYVGVIGVTSDLKGRMYQHKSGVIDGFTKKYKVHLLVWYDYTENIESAIQREKQIKKWKREWKLNLIEKENPEWKDLFGEL